MVERIKEFPAHRDQLRQSIHPDKRAPSYRSTATRIGAEKR
jgi:hypothetical protein